MCTSRVAVRSAFVLLLSSASLTLSFRPLQRSFSISSSSSSSSLQMKTSSLDISTLGDFAKVDYFLKDENGNSLDTPFDQGDVSFVINGGGYASYVHDVANSLQAGESKVDKVLAAPYNEQMAADVPISQAPPGLKVNDVVKLSNGLRARVTEVTNEKVRIDANSELAGKTIVIEMKCIEKKPSSSLKQATFAAGCFWGVELEFQRVAGVAFTAVGYTQGAVEGATYEQVCGGRTGHTEAVTLLYDEDVVTFEALAKTFFARHDPTQKDRQGNDVGTQYRGGIYYHSPEQMIEAQACIAEAQQKYNKPLATELLPAATFWMAEDYHQQYLEKGGQSAKKEATETIRCYG